MKRDKNHSLPKNTTTIIKFCNEEIDEQSKQGNSCTEKT